MGGLIRMGRQSRLRDALQRYERSNRPSGLFLFRDVSWRKSAVLADSRIIWFVGWTRHSKPSALGTRTHSPPSFLCLSQESSSAASAARKTLFDRTIRVPHRADARRLDPCDRHRDDGIQETRHARQQTSKGRKTLKRTLASPPPMPHFSSHERLCLHPRLET